MLEDMTPIPSSPSLKYLHPWDLTHVPPLKPFNDIFIILCMHSLRKITLNKHIFKKIISPSIKTHKGCQLRMPAERYIRYIYLLKCAIKLHLPVKWWPHVVARQLFSLNIRMSCPYKYIYWVNLNNFHRHVLNRSVFRQGKWGFND